MASMSFGAPQPWPPPPTTATKSFKDNCNPGICTTTCLQYCNYFYLQPPPQQQQQFPLINNNSSVDDDDDSSSSRSISPLMAALIAVLAAAFLLLFYYTVVSRFCRRRQTRRNLRRPLDPSTSHRVDPMIHDPARPDTGLDESYIRQITVFKYKRGDGLVEATECAVCLTEFTEEESLRLMPNCEHAFHINCIDTWLVTHSSCPLCRSTMNHLPERAGGGGVSVAALRVERSNDEVVVVENGGEVRIEVVVEVDNEERLEEREKDIP